MQNYLSNFCLFFLIFFIGFSQPVYSQNITPDLQAADSLYKNKQYLRSLAIYRKILSQEEQYSPQMLLKMAYMEEALQHYRQSMYYLNLYYNRFPSKSTLRKMEEVAQAQGLKGYEYRDIDFFRTQFKKYYLKILELLLFVAVGTVTIMVLNRRRSFIGKISFQAGFLFFLAFLFFYINFFSFRKLGIIQNKQAAIMAAPSAGATWMANLGPGNRLHITGETDIWYRVKWQNQNAYIRKNNLKEVPD